MHESEQRLKERPGEAQDSVVEINLAMVGDVLLHYAVYEGARVGDGFHFSHVFEHIAPELEGQDILAVSQETILGGEDLGLGGYPLFNGPQEMGDAEVEAGFNVVLRASNHALDRGYEGLSSELSFWRERHPDVAVIGAVDPADPSTSVEDVRIYEKNGFRVALLNYTYGLNGYEDPLGAVSMLEENHVRTTMAAARKRADMMVVFPHWGKEYSLVPTQDQRAWAKLFVDAGANLIVGAHPHVLEPVELLEGDGRTVPCFWSVGNFVSAQRQDQMLVGGMAKAVLRKEADGSCSVTSASLVPMVAHKNRGDPMATYLLRDWTDELAQTNYSIINLTWNTSLTVEWACEFCAQVLGPCFNRKAARLDLRL